MTRTTMIERNLVSTMLKLSFRQILEYPMIDRQIAAPAPVATIRRKIPKGVEMAVN
ncbi:MAG: hypothetical protein QNJ36_09455 [Calothrix sp. MO_167.B42]|nr:hypothetical protein [Calothrix sp. MO_167.B42]